MCVGSPPIDVAAEPHRAAVGPLRAEEAVEQRRLAGAVRPDEPDDLAFADRQAHVGERGDAREPHRHVLGDEQRLAGGHRTPPARRRRPPAMRPPARPSPCAAMPRARGSAGRVSCRVRSSRCWMKFCDVRFSARTCPRGAARTRSRRARRGCTATTATPRSVEQLGEELEGERGHDRALDRARAERHDEHQPEERELHGEVGLVVGRAFAHREQGAARGRDPRAHRERRDPGPGRADADRRARDLAARQRAQVQARGAAAHPDDEQARDDEQRRGRGRRTCGRS